MWTLALVAVSINIMLALVVSAAISAIISVYRNVMKPEE